MIESLPLSRYRGKGIGSPLLQRALTLCAPGPVTVHAAPDAVALYARHGFIATAPEQLVNDLLSTWQCCKVLNARVPQVKCWEHGVVLREDIQEAVEINL